MSNTPQEAASKWLDMYTGSDFHIRGCMIEGLAQDFEFHGQLHIERNVIILRGIASRMK